MEILAVVLVIGCIILSGLGLAFLVGRSIAKLGGSR